MTQTAKERQLKVWFNKNRLLIEASRTAKEKDYIISMWMGFLSGLRMAGTITRKEYKAYYSKLKNLAGELEEIRA